MSKVLCIIAAGLGFVLLGFADIPIPPPPPGIWTCDFNSDPVFNEGKKEAKNVIKKGELWIFLSGIFSDDVWLTNIEEAGITLKMRRYNSEGDQRFISGFNLEMVKELKKRGLYGLVKKEVRNDHSICKQYAQKR